MYMARVRSTNKRRCYALMAFGAFVLLGMLVTQKSTGFAGATLGGPIGSYLEPMENQVKGEKGEKREKDEISLQDMLKKIIDKPDALQGVLNGLKK